MTTPEMKPLLSIEEEVAACREAFKGVKLYSLVVHCHHEVLFEILTELTENRIAYILSNKPGNEQALRLRLFRPVSKKALKKYPKLDKASAELTKARAELAKISAEWDKAYAEWDKASAELTKADAELDKANAKLDKANAKRAKANAEWAKINADTAIHADICPDCPWDGHTIFPRKS